MSNKDKYKIILNNAKKIKETLVDIVVLNNDLSVNTKAAFNVNKERKIFKKLNDIPFENLPNIVGEEFDVDDLINGGYNSISSIYLIEGEKIGFTTSLPVDLITRIKESVDKLYNDLSDIIPLGIEYENISKEELNLLKNIKDTQAIGSNIVDYVPQIQILIVKLEENIKNVEIVEKNLKWLFSSAEVKKKVANSVNFLSMLLKENETEEIVQISQTALHNINAVKDVDVLADFKEKASDYYSIIESSFGKEYNSKSTFIDDELVEKINNREFDASKIKATLRKYQIFGIKFALTQNRVIIGDEMGLGKTIQAIGVITQRIEEGGSHFLIVCPKAVLINWRREVEGKTSLKLLTIHGTSQYDVYTKWIAQGGVAITTFDTLKNMDLHAKGLKKIKLDTVVADEAHFVKNPVAGRTRAMHQWINKAENVVFLTGTPMENRVQEFIDVSTLVDPIATGKLHNAYFYQGPELFRKEVSPIYLRRNLQEVLSELPELIEITEYCSFEGADYDLYDLYSVLHNWMGMRRASFIPMEPESMPDKMSKIIEIVNDAYSKKKKVIIFSYFKDILNLIHKNLEDTSYAPITGATSSTERQKVIDEFTKSEVPKTLIGQVQALGTGLNIQAASVVILCEPQIKPSLEDQAIARAHRMGQVNKVYVYRLVSVIPDDVQSIDERITDLLERKRYEFDNYARKSNLADASSVLVEAVNLDNAFKQNEGNAHFGGKYENTDFYAVLGVSWDSTDEEVKQGFRNMVKLYHPDINQDNVDSDEKIKLINLAYEILSDKKMRSRYDKIKGFTK